MKAHADVLRRLNLAIDVVAIFENVRVVEDVVQPERASSASPMSVLAREASSVVRAQMRYWAWSHGKRLLFCAAGKLRVRVWLRW